MEIIGVRAAKTTTELSFDKDGALPTFAAALTYAMKVVNITFKFSDGQPDQILTAAEGESVLDVALDHDIDLQHNCGGVCGCSTCHIYVEAGEDDMPEISDKEEDFIDRAVNPRINSRLACQCVVQGNEDIIVTIPEQDFLGH